MQDHQKRRRQHLHQDVADGDSLPAFPALAPQEDIGEDGDVVPRLDRRPAGRAGRGRMGQVEAERQPIDDDVEEAAPGQPEKHHEDQRFHGLTAVATAPLWGS